MRAFKTSCRLPPIEPKTSSLPPLPKLKSGRNPRFQVHPQRGSQIKTQTGKDARNPKIQGTSWRRAGCLGKRSQICMFLFIPAVSLHSLMQSAAFPFGFKQEGASLWSLCLHRKWTSWFLLTFAARWRCCFSFQSSPALFVQLLHTPVKCDNTEQWVEGTAQMSPVGRQEVSKLLCM